VNPRTTPTNIDRDVLETLTRTAGPLLASAEIDAAVQRLDHTLHGLGPIEPLLAESDVSDVMINGDGSVWVERSGALAETDVVIDVETVLRLLERIVGPLGLHVDRASPVVDARLPDGSRVHGIVPPLAVDGPCVTIRRFSTRRITLDEVCPPGVSVLLRWAVRARANVLVCGGAGAGKTTLLNALAAAIPDHERIITVEDAAELRLPGRHVIRLEARPPNAEGVGEIRVRELVRNALRMRPDRIVVGEIRGPEALDMLQAMNTGHDGSLSTCHANTPADALRRVETLVLMSDVALPLAAVREQVASALDLVVHMERTVGGARRVVAVDEVVPGHDPADVSRTVALSDGRGLHTLPTRPPRTIGAGPPRSSWLTPC
jgi:pilus assembly protein CpaF